MFGLFSPRDYARQRIYDLTNDKLKAESRADENARIARVEIDRRIQIEEENVRLSAELNRLKPAYHCSFCGKSQHDVKKLIAGPKVFICDECVQFCVAIVIEEARKS